MFNSNLNKLTIAVDEYAARILKDDLLTWANIELKNLAGKFDDSSVNGRLDKIFEDGRLDRIEAPALFEMCKGLAGKDDLLSKDEIDSSLLHLTIQRFSPAPLKVRKNIGALFDEGMFEDLLVAYSNILQLGNLGDYIEDDGLRREQLVTATHYARLHAESIIEVCENYLKYVVDNETSYFNFISAENVLGIFSWFNDGEPITSFELKGTLQTLSYLRAVRNGLVRLEHRFQEGIVSADGEEVLAALSSPYSSLMHLNCAFTNFCFDTSNTEAEAYFACDLLDAIYSSGAEKLSEELAKMFVENIGTEHDNIITGRLPSGFERWVKNEFTSFANATVSLDSLAFFVAGSGIGMALARSAKAVQAVNTAGNFLKGAKYLIPGVQLLSSKPGQGVAIGLLKFTGNFGFEVAKAGGYISGAYYLMGDNAARWTGRIYNFVLGAVQTFNPAVAWNVARVLKTGQGQDLAVALLELRQRAVAEHAAEIAQYSAMRSFRLSLKAYPKDVNRYIGLLKEVVRRVEKQDRASAKALAVQAKIEQTAEKIWQMASENSAAVQGRHIFSRLDSIYKSAIAAPDKLRALRALRSDVVLLVKKFTRPPEAPLSSTSVPAKPGSSRIERLLAYLGRSKEPAKVQPPPGATKPEATPAPAVVSKTLSTFEAFAETPPKTLDIEIISKATSEKVVVSNRAAKAIKEFYQNNPNQRGSFWRKMNELATGSVQKWEKILGTTNGLYRRMPPYRLLVIKKGTGFELRNIILRGQLHDGTYLKEFL